MLAMRPIDEPDVVELLNAGRFAGEVEGYIMMDGPEYLGHALFLVEEGVTTVLDCGVEQPLMADGIVRACIAAGENRGAAQFAVNLEDEKLAAWWNTYCKGLAAPQPTSRIFQAC